MDAGRRKGWTSVEHTFSMLNVRSEPASSARPGRTAASGSDDLTTRARIRDAAIARFARDGFGAPLRTIATDAGVSAALVVHHFGSKDGLRAACDAYVFDAVRQAKTGAISPQDPAGGPMAMFAQLAELESYAPLFEYTLRSLQAGGDLARSFVEHLGQVTLEYLEAGVAAGVIRPSRDEAARASYLVSLSLGSLLIDGALRERSEPRDPEADLRGYVERVMLPALEVFTEGLFVEPTLLDAYVRHTTHPEETR